MNMTVRQQTLGSRRERVRADVCVIGAGAAGLVAATRVAAATGRSVVVLESGNSVPDALIAGLDTVHSPDGSYSGTHRSRGMGGTSTLWAGKLLPLSLSDMAARPHVGLDAWPIGADTLARYVPEVEALLRIDHDAYDGQDARAFDPHGHLPASPAEIAWRWPKHPVRKRFRIDHALHEQMAALPNLSIWVDATVARLTMAQGRLAMVTAINHRGGELIVDADQFILAAGTLESTRLLLLADAQNQDCISRTTDALGRYFNDHFGVNVAKVSPGAGIAANQAFADRTVKATKRHLHGELTEVVQRSQGVASAYFDFDLRATPGSASGAARAALDDLRAGRIGKALRHLPPVLGDLGPLARAGFWLGVRGQKYWPEGADIHVKIWIEQLPHHASRLTLGSQLDSLGQPVLRADIVKTDNDERTARTMVDVLRRLWDRDLSRLATLHWTLPETGRLIDAATEQAHPAGSTRMGLNPARSVVDPSLRVHAIRNVRVASASVFPSSGSANPTLTIMQLAMLAADAVVRELGSAAKA